MRKIRAGHRRLERARGGAMEAEKKREEHEKLARGGRARKRTKVEGKAPEHHNGKRARGGRAEPKEEYERQIPPAPPEGVARGSARSQSNERIAKKPPPGTGAQSQRARGGSLGEREHHETTAARDNGGIEEDEGRAKGGKLTAAKRQSLPRSDFALPGHGSGPKGAGSGSYPIPDASHARNALARVSQHGSSEEKARVRAAVHRKFPGIGQSNA